MRTAIRIIAVCVGVLAAGTAGARIHLTTLPEREAVRIDIQNGHYTLVEEERTVNLQAGRNQVDFSWANIGIDKSTILFRVIRANGAVSVLDTNYPPNETALYWTVSAERAGPAVIRVSYLIDNMAAVASYQGIVDHDEKHLLLQVYMTVTNTSGEDFGECHVQPGVGLTTVRYFLNGERKRMLAAKFAEVPILKRYVFDALIDQDRTRMYYRLINDRANLLGAFPLPAGKARLFIKEGQAGDADEVRSQAFLGEDWAAWTPLFAPLDLYVGVAQDVKVQRFVMQPEDGPRNEFDVLTCPRILVGGGRDTIEPQFRHQRTRLRYRLQNFKTDNAGQPSAMPLTIKEKVDGEWVVEKVELKRLDGERDGRRETTVPHDDLFKAVRIDVNTVEFQVQVPPTTADTNYDLYVTIMRKNRRY
jgi:hypothetical protein